MKVHALERDFPKFPSQISVVLCYSISGKLLMVRELTRVHGSGEQTFCKRLYDGIKIEASSASDEVEMMNHDPTSTSGK